ncbi:MAG: hypothetical protein Q8S09_01505 [Hyphomonas sp.]|nr:hypothetical protein [Hyphomonas sp.]
MPQPAVLFEQRLKVPLSRVTAVYFVAIIAAVGLASVLAFLTGVQIHYRNWLAYVVLQLIIQVAATWLTVIANGRAEDDRATALALFALSVGAIMALTPLLLRPWFSSQEYHEAALQFSLLGAIYCTALGEQCVQLADGTVTAIFLALLVVSIFLALVLREGSDRSRSPVPLGALAFGAALCVSITLLTITEWYGDVTPRPRPGTGAGVVVDASRLAVVRAGPAFVSLLLITILLLQASAFALAVMSWADWRKARWPDGAVDRLVAVLFFCGRFLRDTIVLLFGVAVIVALIAGFAAGFVTTLRFIEAIITWLAQGFGDWSGGPRPEAPEMTALANSGGPILALIGSALFWLLSAVSILYVIWLCRAVIERLGALLWKALLRAVRIGILAAIMVAIGVVTVRLWPTAGPPEEPPVCDSPLANCDPLPPPPVHRPFAETFKPLPLECVGAVDPERFYWAYASPYHFSFDANACRWRDPSEPPATILIFGTASRDDTAAGGYRLSARRAQFLAEKASLQNPHAEIVVVALGRQLGDPGRRSAEDDIYSYDRRIVVLASPVKWRVPFADTPLQAAQTLTRVLQREEGYEFCALQSRISRWQEIQFPIPTRRDCHWSEVADQPAASEPEGGE